MKGLFKFNQNLPKEDSSITYYTFCYTSGCKTSAFYTNIWSRDLINNVRVANKENISLFANGKGQFISEWNFPKLQRKNCKNFFPKIGQTKEIRAQNCANH